MTAGSAIAEGLETLSATASCSVSATVELVLKVPTDQRSVDTFSFAGRERIVRGIVEVTRGLRELVAEQRGELIDRDGALADRLLTNETEVVRALEALRRESPSGGAEAFERLTEPFVRLAEALRDLRWAVMEHDAELEPVPERGFRSAEELIGHLKGEG